jgi:hypothetical protein
MEHNEEFAANLFSAQVVTKIEIVWGHKAWASYWAGSKAQGKRRKE